ncbi:MAG: 50S ribosomal protein L21 [Bacteroidetes bacterium]|nr:50S ribosomal protein L21 [Bacteroidota bacterium]
MYAIVNIAGQQFKVENEQNVIVHRLAGEVGSKVEFNSVMLINNDGKVVVGEPLIEGAKVTATILSHLKGDKVIIFKKRRRKGYQKSSGHRQFLTKIQIDSVAEKASKAKKVKAEAPVETEN